MPNTAILDYADNPGTAIPGDTAIVTVVEATDLATMDQPSREYLSGMMFYATKRKSVYVLDRSSVATPVGEVVIGATRGGNFLLGALGVASSILWGPGGDAETWAEVMAYVDASKGPITIFAMQGATPLQIPAGTYEMKGARLVGPKFGEETANVVEVLDNAVLRNLESTYGAILVKSLSSIPCFENDPLTGGPALYLCDVDSEWQAAGTGPMISVGAGELVVIACINGGFLASVPGIVDVEAGGVLIGTFIDGQHALDDSWLKGAIGSVFALGHDGNYPFPFTAPSFLGTTVNAPIGIVGGAGPTTFRPTALVSPPRPVPLGCMYFDTDLVPPIPIWWTGAAWVDATGAPV